jgi:Protein of unknown function (DUF2591)
MKVKTSELIGEPLNYAVAIIEYGIKKVYINPDIRRKGIWVIPQKNGGKNHFHPSKSWAQGGAIIDRARMDFQWEPFGKAEVLALLWMDGVRHHAYGGCHLVAAMRCYVASRLGAEVDIPEELLK